MDEKEAAKHAVESGLLSQIWHWIVLGVTFVGGWLWNHTMGRLQRLETTKLDQEVFKEYLERMDAQRVDFRHDIKDLFEGQTEVKQTLARIEGTLAGQDDRENRRKR